MFGMALVLDGIAITVVGFLLGAHWWFVIPSFVIVALMKGYAHWGSLDEVKLDRAEEKSERPTITTTEVLLRFAPAFAIWCGLDVVVLLLNADVGGAIGGLSIGIGLAWLNTGRLLVRYGRKQGVVIVSEIPRLYFFWRRPDGLMRAVRPL